MTNTVYVIADKTRQKEVLARLETVQERYRYPIRELEVHAFGEDDVEIEATLTATSVEADELDSLVRRLSALPEVRQAFLSPSTAE